MLSGITGTPRRVCDRCGATVVIVTDGKRDGAVYVTLNRSVRLVPLDGEARRRETYEDLCIKCAEADPAIKDAVQVLQNLPGM